MKTVTMEREFVYSPFEKVHIRYLGGATYDRVPEAAVREIVKAKAGYIVKQPPAFNNVEDLLAYLNE